MDDWTMASGGLAGRERPLAVRRATQATFMLAAVLATGGLGCSEDLGGVTFYGPGLTETRVRLDTPGTISFVTNLEVEGPKNLEAAAGDFRYEIEARQGGRAVATTQCDPLRVGESWTRSRRASSTRIGSYRHSITEAQLVSCSLNLAEAGPTALRIRLVQVRSSAATPLTVVLLARR